MLLLLADPLFSPLLVSKKSLCDIKNSKNKTYICIFTLIERNFKLL